ncbi:coiled-coil domain-containing protein 28B-like isoform X2 [Lytechinus pictus]|uniref:coiled-coil domain-containing protein 28B-like isoform X2 n=1 Tax=Lytechinus pictus TaxID=7653 RepID=UPI0030B9D358
MASARIGQMHGSPKTLHQTSSEVTKIHRPASLVAPHMVPSSLTSQPGVKSRHTRGHSLGQISSPVGYPPGMGRDFRGAGSHSGVAWMGPQYARSSHSLVHQPSKHSKQPAGSAPNRTAKNKTQEKSKHKTVVDGAMEAGCKEHSFITNASDIRQMQNGLLNLLEEFNSGKLQAFDESCSYEKMSNVRDLQEKLARLHFEMDDQLQAQGVGSKEAITLANQNMDHLLSNRIQSATGLSSSCPFINSN